MKTLIVGGVAGGASAAARLRRLDENAEIIMFERGDYISFANCGLPYYIGGEIKDKNMLTLQTPQSFRQRFNIDVRIKSEVTGINPEKNTVTVTNNGITYEENYDNLILSMGAEPIKPNIEGINSDRIFTLRNIPDTYRITDFIIKNKPQTAVIAGGGYIGVEMAENLKNCGLNVYIVELADHLIAPLDFDMACEVQEYLQRNGINVIVNNGIKSIKSNEKLTCVLENGEIQTDMLIMSVGVKPETKIASDCGIKTNNRGAIITDRNMKTNIENIYAVGDAVEVIDYVTGNSSYVPLAGPANKQGRIAADNICGINSEYTGTQGSSVLKIFDMTVAVTGINERAAKAAGINYDKTYTYSASHASYYPGAMNMSVKILWDKESKKLLGAQIVGYEGVDKRMDVIATSIRFGAKVTDLVNLELCYAPPFSSAKDPVNMAGFVAENVITNKVKQFFWDDVDKLPRDGSVTLLDVRTNTEVMGGKINGFMHIPLDSLRDNINKIPKDKPVYVHCHSGLRSYIASRILTGIGYDCYNLAGGYRFYQIAAKHIKTPEYICTQCK